MCFRMLWSVSHACAHECSNVHARKKQAIHDQQGEWHPYGLPWARPLLTAVKRTCLCRTGMRERRRRRKKKGGRRTMRMWQLWVICDRRDSGCENAEEKTRNGEHKNKIMTPQGLQWKEMATDLGCKKNIAVKSGRLKVDQLKGRWHRPPPPCQSPAVGNQCGTCGALHKNRNLGGRKLPAWSESVWFHSSLKLNLKKKGGQKCHKRSKKMGGGEKCTQ